MDELVRQLESLAKDINESSHTLTKVTGDIGTKMAEAAAAEQQTTATAGIYVPPQLPEKIALQRAQVVSRWRESCGLEDIDDILTTREWESVLRNKLIQQQCQQPSRLGVGTGESSGSKGLEDPFANAGAVMKTKRTPSITMGAPSANNASWASKPLTRRSTVTNLLSASNATNQQHPSTTTGGNRSNPTAIGRSHSTVGTTAKGNETRNASASAMTYEETEKLKERIHDLEGMLSRQGEQITKDMKASEDARLAVVAQSLREEIVAESREILKKKLSEEKSKYELRMQDAIKAAVDKVKEDMKAEHKRELMEFQQHLALLSKQRSANQTPS